MKNLYNWKHPSNWLSIKTIDMHTGGEPLRIIIDGLPELQGNSVLEQRKYFRDNLDFICKALIFEPRGHADMYGAVIMPAFSKDADFGTFFIHNEGYSTMCGHAILALTKFAMETGIVQLDRNKPKIIIDAPAGKLYAKANIIDGIVTRSSFRNVPSFVLYLNRTVQVPG